LKHEKDDDVGFTTSLEEVNANNEIVKIA